MRIVLDTNIIISALGWEGPERNVLRGAVEGRYIILTSKDLIGEFLGVIGRDKFNGIKRSDIRDLLLFMYQVFEVVEVRSRFDVIKDDPDDNMVLECAVDGKADMIISGDRHLLELGEFRGIKIKRSKDLSNI